MSPIRLNGGPLWKALKLGIADPHYYCYQYTSQNTVDGRGSAFSAQAFGDLDGDGTTGLVERAGRGTDNLDVEGSGGLYELNPLE